MEKIEKIIREKLAEEFHVFRILRVRVREDHDSDGERVLLIDVIFDGERKHLDANAFAGAVRKVRPVLLENNEDAFPVFSFIAKSEAGRLSRETARPH